MAVTVSDRPPSPPPGPISIFLGAKRPLALSSSTTVRSIYSWGGGGGGGGLGAVQCVSERTQKYVCVCLRACMHTYACTSHASVSECVCVGVRVCARVCVCVAHVHVYVCVHFTR